MTGKEKGLTDKVGFPTHWGYTYQVSIEGELGNGPLKLSGPLGGKALKWKRGRCFNVTICALHERKRETCGGLYRHFVFGQLLPLPRALLDPLIYVDGCSVATRILLSPFRKVYLRPVLTLGFPYNPEALGDNSPVIEDPGAEKASEGSKERGSELGCV